MNSGRRLTSGARNGAAKPGGVENHFYGDEQRLGVDVRRGRIPVENVWITSGRFYKYFRLCGVPVK